MSSSKLSKTAERERENESFDQKFIHRKISEWVPKMREWDRELLAATEEELEMD